MKACVVALNEPHELETFRAHLDPMRFEIVDLRAVAAAAHPSSLGAPDGAGGSWLMDACTPDTTCDLVVYSAEFAGRFFGKQGASLSLEEMEEASCQARCAGLFQRPQEVFLLACNTLATKDQDMRTPEGRTRVRYVDTASEGYRVAREYMLRLEPEDFHDDAWVERLAEAANLTSDRLRARFERPIA